MRAKILASVGALVLCSLLGSTVSLLRITEVRNSLDAINRTAIPFGRILTQLQADSDILAREMERRLGTVHWKDPHWRPQPTPRWIVEVLSHELAVARSMLSQPEGWESPEVRDRWNGWVDEVAAGLESMQVKSRSVYDSLVAGDLKAAARLYPEWKAQGDSWARRVEWGTREYERGLRRRFATAESSVSGLRTGLQVILAVVVVLSLLLLWLGERALRPLAELTRLARDITERGLRKEDKARLPAFPLTRGDEVSGLGREFHRMATALLEREKTVETQRGRLEAQNRLLREMGSLNENVLRSIRSVLIATDPQGRITQCNALAAEFLGRSPEAVIGTRLADHERLAPVVAGIGAAALDETARIAPTELRAGLGEQKRVYGGRVQPLRDEEGASAGLILALEDLTDQLDLERRLRSAENLAAVGRMSAQVAHEVRNPLHAIGLEAEYALEALSGNESAGGARQSLQSILAGVDRLEKITQSYLRLSRLTEGTRGRVDLRDVLEAVLATYYPVCEARGVRVDWRLERAASFLVLGDRDLLEQAFGNLVRNALEALEGAGVESPRIDWSLGNTEDGRVWVRIQDNGPGVSAAILDRLFSPFVTTKAQGTGLGLSFSRKVLADHGGDLRLGPASPGGGACFELLIPGAAVAEETRKPEGEAVV
ncbi:MAG: PAS domain-containing protein [Bdellovibrionales bacterium]|nr:PAS domain-containing protein [Bdellovibrionales bacterium]